MTETAGLEINVKATGVKSATDDLKKLGGAAGKSESLVKGLAGEMAKLAGGVSVGAAFLYAANAGKDFNRALSELSAITGATGKDLAFLEEQAKELGRTTGTSATEALKAFQLMASAKPELLESAEALSSVTREALKLSEAASIDMPRAAEVLGTSLNQFGADADQAGRFINVLAAGAKFGASEITDTADALKNSGAAAAAAGVSFEGVNTAIQALAAGGLKGAEAGTGLRSVMLKLESDANQKLRPSVVGLTSAIVNLSKENLTVTELTDKFGLESVTAAATLVKQAAAMDTLEKSMTGTGVAYDQASTNTDNLAGDQAKLLSAANELSIVIGQELDPALRSLAQTLTDTIKETAGFSKWVGETLGISAREGTSQLVHLSDEIAGIEERLAKRKEGFSFFAGKGSLDADTKNLARLKNEYAELFDLESQRAAAAAEDRAAAGNQPKPPPSGAPKGNPRGALDEITDASNRARDAAASHAKALGDQISALEFQASVVGKDKDEVTLLKLALDGATESQLASAQAALGTVTAYEKQAEQTEKLKKKEEERDQRNKGFKQEALSDIEVLAQKQQGYYDALQEHGITQDEFNKLSVKNGEAMKQVAYGADEATTALDDFAKTAQENIQSQLADTLTNGFQGSFKDILSGWGQLVQRMIAEAAAAQLTSSLFGALGVGGPPGAGAAGGAGGLASIGSFFAGFFDNGGNIPAGKFGVVGERGPELVRGPVNVTGREDTAKMSGGNTIIINQPGVSSTREAERSAGATRRAVMGAVNSGSRYA